MSKHSPLSSPEKWSHSSLSVFLFAAIIEINLWRKQHGGEIVTVPGSIWGIKQEEGRHSTPESKEKPVHPCCLLCPAYAQINCLHSSMVQGIGMKWCQSHPGTHSVNIQDSLSKLCSMPALSRSSLLGFPSRLCLVYSNKVARWVFCPTSSSSFQQDLFLLSVSLQWSPSQMPTVCPDMKVSPFPWLLEGLNVILSFQCLSIILFMCLKLCYMYVNMFGVCHKTCCHFERLQIVLHFKMCTRVWMHM